MAEIVFRDVLHRAGLSDRVTVASAATSREELGNPVYPPARRELARHGLSAEGKHAVLLVAEDYARYDMLIGMDDRNLFNMGRLFGGDPERKLFKMMRFADEERDVADPWYTGDFEATYRDVCAASAGLLRHITALLKA